MTCIVGITNGKRVIIGGDSAFSKGKNVIVTDDPAKVLKVNGWVIGLCGHMDVVSNSRNILYSEQWKTISELSDLIKSSVSKGSEYAFIAGYRGILYSADSDGAFFRCQDRRDGRKLVRGSFAVGSGEEYALGSLHSTFNIKDDEVRIKMALEASVYHSDGVRPPFRIVSE